MHLADRSWKAAVVTSYQNCLQNVDLQAFQGPIVFLQSSDGYCGIDNQDILGREKN